MGKEKVPYHTVCSCNPANGGSGICGCIMGNKLVDPDMHGHIRTRLLSDIPDDWWQGPYIERMPNLPQPLPKSRLVMFLEMRIEQCEQAINVSDILAYYRGMIAAYQEMLEELNINNK